MHDSNNIRILTSSHMHLFSKIAKETIQIMRQIVIHDSNLLNDIFVRFHLLSNRVRSNILRSNFELTSRSMRTTTILMIFIITETLQTFCQHSRILRHLHIRRVVLIMHMMTATIRVRHTETTMSIIARTRNAHIDIMIK